MRQLIKKYRTDRLTSTELHQLKQQLGEMSDEELASHIEQDWMDNDASVTAAEGLDLSQVWKRLKLETGRQRSHSVFRSILKYAAILAIPLLSFATVYLYMESQSGLDDETFVTTGKGEKASVLLPDGTKVTLFYESCLGYVPKSFNRDERKVRFDGEARFCVKRDKEHPFVISNKHIDVTVLGTLFNLSVRRTDDHAELYLEEGSVSLHSPATGERVMMKPHDRALVDYHTGSITLEHLRRHPISLSNGYLTFNCAPLSKVISTIEANFGCNINVADKSNITKTFSGTIPASNIGEALEVLSLSFEINVSRVGNTYTLH